VNSPPIQPRLASLLEAGAALADSLAVSLPPPAIVLADFRGRECVVARVTGGMISDASAAIARNDRMTD